MSDALNQLGDDMPVTIGQQLAQQPSPQAQAAGSQANANVPQQAQPGGFFKSMLASILQGIGAGAGVGAGGDTRNADIGAAFHAGAQGATENSPLAISQRNNAAQQEQQAFQSQMDLRKAQNATALVQGQEAALRLSQMKDEYAEPLVQSAVEYANSVIKSGAGKVLGTGTHADMLKALEQVHQENPSEFLDHRVVPQKDGKWALIQIKQGGAKAPDTDQDHVLAGNEELNVPERHVLQKAGEDPQQFDIRLHNEFANQAKALSVAASLKANAANNAQKHEDDSLRAAALNASNTTKIQVADINNAGRMAVANLQTATKSGDQDLITAAKDLAVKTKAVSDLAKSKGLLGSFLPKTDADKQAVMEQQQAQQKYDLLASARGTGNTAPSPTSRPSPMTDRPNPPAGFKRNPDGSIEEQ